MIGPARNPRCPRLPRILALLDDTSPVEPVEPAAADPGLAVAEIELLMIGLR